MAVRFLDSVSVNSFTGNGDSTINGTPIPSTILQQAYFTIATNTATSTFRVSVFGTLKIERGAEVQAPDNSVVYTHGQLWVENVLDTQGVVINDGLIVIGDG